MYSNLVDKKYMFLLCNGIVGLIMGSFRGNSETIFHGKANNIVEQTKAEAIKDMRVTKVKKAVALLGEKSVSKEEEEEEERVALFRGAEEVIKYMRETEVKKALALLGEKSVSKEEEEERVALFRGGEEGIKYMREAEVKKAVALLGEKSVSEEEEDEERVALFRGGEEEVTLVVEDDDEGILVQDLTINRIGDHDDEEMNDSLLSVEDLNKKCEDFIRKMKAEIRFGITC